MRTRALWGGLSVVLLALAACGPEPTAPLPPPTYVGNAACEPCHAAEFKSHAASRHMQTLLVASKTELGALAPKEGTIPGGGRVSYDQDQLMIEFPHKDTGAPVPVPIDLAVGSGKSGMTYMAIHDQGSVEIRRSYFPKEKAWHFTPGMESYDPSIVGVNVTVPDTIKCLQCHSVPVPNGPLAPERKFLGVGCESCHGPGGAHVFARQKGLKTLGLTPLTGVGGTAINEVCGKCHQTRSSISKDMLNTKATNRFQPYGLSLSACFKKSADKLSCVTCHSPHADASTDTKGYEKTCLSCHTAPPQKACPVNPKEKCISCHMPQKPAFSDSKLAVRMADHFIRRPGKEE